MNLKRKEASARLAFCILISLIVLIFDQASKMAVIAFLPASDAIKICPFFNLTLVLNRGTSFGLLEPSTMTEFYMIVGLTVCCITFLTYCFIKFRTFAEKMLLGVIIGGAVGNLVDRIIHGAVIDFIDLYCGAWHWPAFNLADTAISCGAVLLLLVTLFSKRGE
ncbi:MAG: signal peptidase II [Holosporales bacterium]|jgi:signal peptidase II|nr:signal peptidase II [Holosporales bacterium]